MFPNRMQELALDTGRTVEEVEPGLAGILWLDVFMSLLFLGFVAGGILRRNRRREHKRLMLFAGLAFLFAAVFRLSGMVGQLTGLAFGPLLGLLILVLLWMSVLVHDRRKEGRILAVTWTGFGSTGWRSFRASCWVDPPGARRSSSVSSPDARPAPAPCIAGRTLEDGGHHDHAAHRPRVRPPGPPGWPSIMASSTQVSST
jgi:hypothetical protein